MNPLQESLNEISLESDDRETLEQRVDIIMNQLEYMSELYGFLDQYQRLETEPDDLHRFLFDRTNFTHRNFKYRMGRVARSLEVTRDLLMEYELVSAIQVGLGSFGEEVDQEDIHRIIEGVFEELDPDEEFSELKERMVDILDSLFSDLTLEQIVEIAEDNIPNVFDNAAKRVRELADIYEATLVEEGLIEESQGGTPPLPLMIFAAFWFVAGGYITAIGYLHKDAIDMLTGIVILSQLGFALTVALML